MRSALFLSLVTAAFVGVLSLTRGAEKRQRLRRPHLAAGDDESYLFVG